MISGNPLVSVILSAYNDEDYIRESIESILGQTYSNIEFLIADDASLDETRRIIDSYKDQRIRIYHNSTNIGLLRTWNRLLSLSNGSYIVFQDADDVSHEDRVLRLVKFLEANKNVFICGSNYIRFHKFWGLTTSSNFPLEHSEIVASVDSGVVPFFGKVMFRREVFDIFGFFREYFIGLGWEDFDLILRVLEKRRISNIPDLLYHYRYRENSSSKITMDSPLERLFIDRIGFFLHEQRMKRGTDAIEVGNLNEIRGFVETLTRSLGMKEISYLKYSRVMLSMISNRDFVNSFKLWFLNLKSYGMRFENYLLLFKLLYYLANTILKYLIFRFKGKLKYSLSEIK
ncbi:MAG: glycosyltransferase family 2 protein [Bacteroidetes bacterium CHB5]|nr:glycosyltransferase family 2 protein [Bacteroidetes bacterium CHB5]